MTELLQRREPEGIVRLTLNAPERLNVLSEAMLAALDRDLGRLESDPDTRVVVIAASGKAFCAGHDLAEMTAARDHDDGGAAYFADLFARCAALMRRLTRLPQPVIAEVQGVATAAGCQMVAACDLAVAAEGARFGVNGIDLGLFCSTPMVPLSRNLPRKQAFELLATGGFLLAEEARRLGLVNRVVPAEDLRGQTDALARTIAAKRPGAMRIGKRAFHEQIDLPLDEAYDLTVAAMARNMGLPETEAGIAAFLDRARSRRDAVEARRSDDTGAGPGRRASG